MSKYDKLWQYIGSQKDDELSLGFDQIQQITGLPIAHSFLSFKKELEAYGFKVGKISLKNKTISFQKLN